VAVGNLRREGDRLAVRVTDRVQIGRFIFEIGAPEGTRADLGTVAAGENPGELALALSQPPPAGGTIGPEETLVETESTTGKVEQALELFTGYAQGRVDRTSAVKEADGLMATLERLDRQQRPADTFRLARSLTGSLALLGRWFLLVQGLRMALGAAVALGDRAGEAWARHELGTFSLGAEDEDAAVRELEEARRIRHKLGDKAGEELTEHNLATAQRAFGTQGWGWSKPMIVAAIDEGDHVSVVRGVDAAGTTGPEANYKWTVDIDSAERTSDTAAEVAFTPSESETDVTCELFESSDLENAVKEVPDCTTPVKFTGLDSASTYVVAITATDAAGKVGEAAKADIPTFTP
jgi:hypothetical protein